MSRLEFKMFSDSVNRERQRYKVKAGSAIFEAGQCVKSIFFCVSGSVRMEVFPDPGKPMVLYRAYADEAFAEEHLARDRYSYSAIADEPCVIESAPKQLILNDIGSNPELGARFITCLAERYYQLRVSFERLGINSASARVLHLLMTLESQEGIPLNLSGRIKGLSRDLNLSHEAAYRALKNLEAENIIRRENGVITYIDRYHV